MSKPVSKVREARLELYRKKGKIHVKAVAGRFNTLRWAMVWLTQTIFYGLCWLNWESAGASRQAVLFDIAHEKFHFLGLTLWPQDGLLLAIVLILAALGLFLATTYAGRLFCGFACPQSVYTSIFTWVEARVEGDHLDRLKLDQSPMSPRKLGLRLAKHGIWALIAAWTGITFVGYFTPIRQLLPLLAGWQVGPWEGFWVIFYSSFTYVQAGLAREAVCQHMCPYSRFQGVMVDGATRTISYDAGRGEPRSHTRQGAGGDCIDCGICVQACPTGIDIREGLQYQCINCGLCADACDQVMGKVGQAPGLIRFASERELAGKPAPGGWLGRPRLAIYASLFAAFAALGAMMLFQRPLLLVDVLRDRYSLMRETAEGRIENTYTLKLMNMADAPRDFEVALSGTPGMQIEGSRQFGVGAGRIRAVQLSVSAPADAARPAILPIRFRVTARQAPATSVVENSTFVLH